MKYIKHYIKKIKSKPTQLSIIEIEKADKEAIQLKALRNWDSLIKYCDK